MSMRGAGWWFDPAPESLCLAVLTEMQQQRLHELLIVQVTCTLLPWGFVMALSTLGRLVLKCDQISGRPAEHH